MATVKAFDLQAIDVVSIDFKGGFKLKVLTLSFHFLCTSVIDGVCIVYVWLVSAV